jgi:hypothetical protein
MAMVFAKYLSNFHRQVFHQHRVLHSGSDWWRGSIHNSFLDHFVVACCGSPRVIGVLMLRTDGTSHLSYLGLGSSMGSSLCLDMNGCTHTMFSCPALDSLDCTCGYLFGPYLGHFVFYSLGWVSYCVVWHGLCCPIMLFSTCFVYSPSQVYVPLFSYTCVLIQSTLLSLKKIIIYI